MSYYFRQKQLRPQTTSNTRQLDNSAMRDSRLVQQSQQLSKQFTTPKMYRDREILYEENIKLKGQMNEIVQELIQQKSRVSQLEKELQRFENLIDDSIKPDCSQQKLVLERYGLVLKMKARQKQLLIELQNKNKELNELKRSLRYTNYQELEVELKSYVEECIRLRQQLDYNQQMIALQSSGESFEKKILHLEKTIKILQRDNQELADKQCNNDAIQQSLQIKVEETTKQNERQFNEILKQEQTIKELTEYNRQCNDLISQLQQTNRVQIQHQQSNNQDELQKVQLQLDTAQSKYQQEIDSKNQEIRSLKTEIQRQKLEIESIERVLENQEEKIRELESSAYSPISKIGQIDSPLQNGFKIMQIEMKAQVMKKKLPKVQFLDIRGVCMQVKLNLFRHRVPFAQIDTYFIESDEMSIHQVKNILHRPPFEIQDHQQMKLLSRYLVEDNSEDFVMYDQEKTNSTAIIKSVMKKVIGKYEIFSSEEELEIIQSIKQVNNVSIFQKLNPSIIETIQMMTAKNKNLEPNTCDITNFDQALKFHEIQFSQKEQEKLNMICFEVSNSLEIINYQKLFDYFA